ncbi:DUF5412 domain-containing protein [Paenibacillus qinlingensis]|uniref:DUF5412 domain-containing protein n=1 Tax=Paenibacillus qinlingensis TaxID=1837343 RepID=A0ABU1NRR7_9BACL|nr:DUF5412 domain-containing protein [Paenibacillus qinlingensis]MDR6550148.1 hypothetical protein [Paenibacillus qinlingensis]
MTFSDEEQSLAFEMKRTKRNVLTFFLCIGLLIIGILGYGIYWAFFDMNRLPTGSFLDQSSSPNGTYTIKAYLTNGGATTGYALRAELIFNNNAQKTKNIYWNDREENVHILWIDEDTVQINGHELELPHEKFDFRRNR